MLTLLLFKTANQNKVKSRVSIFQKMQKQAIFGLPVFTISRQVLSPYHAMGCNPVSMVDPLRLRAGLAPGTKLLNFMPPNAGIAYVEGQRVVLGGAMTFDFDSDYASHLEFYAQWVKEGAGEYKKASNRGYGEMSKLSDALVSEEIGPNDYISYISQSGENVYVKDVDGNDIIYSIEVSSGNQQSNGGALGNQDLIL